MVPVPQPELRPQAPIFRGRRDNHPRDTRHPLILLRMVKTPPVSFEIHEGTHAILFYFGHRLEDQRNTQPPNRACSPSTLIGLPWLAKEPMSTITSTRAFRMPQSLIHPSSPIYTRPDVTIHITETESSLSFLQSPPSSFNPSLSSANPTSWSDISFPEFHRNPPNGIPSVFHASIALSLAPLISFLIPFLCPCVEF